jgi:cobalamin biosynthesis Mg chelatase CobN
MLRQALRLACAVILLAGVMVTSGAAQTIDRRTLFTFSGPVSIPGVTLPPGQYLFRLADPTTSRTVVQVLSADGTTPYGMFFTYPADRFEAAERPEVRFMETAKGMPAAIRTWWYPGERRGYEFIYPKDQARKLAQGANPPVLTTQAPTTTTAETNTSELARVSSAGQETTVSADAKPTTATPAGTTQSGTVAAATLSIPNATIPPASASESHAPATAVATAGAPVTQSARTRLPNTASPVPLVAVCGLLALCAGVAVSNGRRPRML